MRGDGRVYQRAGTTCWHIAYNHRGQEIRESSGSPNKKDAEKLLRRRLKEVGADSLGLKAFVGPQQDRVTVGELLDALEIDLGVRQIKSLKQNIGHLRIAREAFGHLRAVNLTTEMVSRYIEERLAEGQAPATVNRRTGMLAAALRLAVRRRRLSYMPEIPKLREDNARQGFFAGSDFFAVLPHLGDPDVADYLEWFFWTGMRPGEIQSLTWKAFDSETWMLRLHAKDAKTGQGRAIALEGPYREIIERRMRARQFGCDLIFHKEDGRTIGTFYKRWYKALQLAGVARMKPYDLRRTAIRNMKRGGSSDRDVMAVSGHRTRAVFDRYNIISEDDLRQTAIKTAAYVKSLADGSRVVSIDQSAALKAAK